MTRVVLNSNMYSFLLQCRQFYPEVVTSLLSRVQMQNNWDRGKWFPNFFPPFIEFWKCLRGYIKGCRSVHTLKRTGCVQSGGVAFKFPWTQSSALSSVHLRLVVNSPRLWRCIAAREGASPTRHRRTRRTPPRHTYVPSRCTSSCSEMRNEEEAHIVSENKLFQHTEVKGSKKKKKQRRNDVCLHFWPPALHQHFRASQRNPICRLACSLTAAV